MIVASCVVIVMCNIKLKGDILNRKGVTKMYLHII